MHHRDQGPVVPEEAQGEYLPLILLWLDWGVGREYLTGKAVASGWAGALRRD